MDLPTADLPAGARVFVEAYRSSPAGRMRFDLGTVAEVAEAGPQRRALADFDDDLPPPLFRVKVTDVSDLPGRLLADASGIRAVDPDAKPAGRVGLLYVAHRDLKGPVWSLDLDYAGYEPTLWIDADADAARELPHDARFAGLVYPEVLRQILQHVRVTNPALAEAGEWGRPWVEFAAGLAGMQGVEFDATAEDDGTHPWVADAVCVLRPRPRL